MVRRLGEILLRNLSRKPWAQSCKGEALLLLCPSYLHNTYTVCLSCRYTVVILNVCTWWVQITASEQFRWCQVFGHTTVSWLSNSQNVLALFWLSCGKPQPSVAPNRLTRMLRVIYKYYLTQFCVSQYQILPFSFHFSYCPTYCIPGLCSTVEETWFQTQALLAVRGFPASTNPTADASGASLWVNDPGPYLIP